MGCHCASTLAPSYRSIAVTEAGAVAAMAESRKSTKYDCLPHSYLFSPVAVESFGAFGPKSLSLLFELGRRIQGMQGPCRICYNVSRSLFRGVML